MIFVRSSLILVIILFIASPSTSEDDLYKVLGVKKSSSAKEIKKAYKDLAREWHPDKNSDPEANEKFMKINEAYETLSDPEKRSQYDNFGTTAGDMGQQHRGGGGPGFHGFESFFSGSPFGGFNFHFGEGGRRRRESNLDTHRITIRALETKVIPESKFKPYLLFAYADFCFQCMQVENIWERVRGDLESIGMGTGTVHVHMDPGVSRKLRISSIPAFIAVVKGKPIHFSGRHFSIQGIRDFVRGLFPTDLVQELSDKTYDQFLKGWKDNHVRMVFCDDTNVLSLRYLAAAYANRDRLTAGYIQTNRLGTESFRRKYAVKQSGETFLVFNEETETPVAHINMKTISRSTMDQVIDSNEYLIVPRLSSQNIFNNLCPTASSMKKKMLCVVLLSRNIAEHDDYLSSFRQYVQDHQDQDQRVKYAYVWEDTQTGFVQDLTKGMGITNDTLGTLKVAVIWRRDKKVHYDWLEEGWYPTGSHLMKSRRQLHRLVDWVLQSRDTLPHVMEMRLELTDEHIEALMSRILNKLRDWGDVMWDKITHIDEVSVITLIATVTFIIVIGFMMKTLVSIEEDKVTGPRLRRNEPSRSNDTRQHYSQPQQPVVSVHPLCSQNFEELIIHTEPGVRCIVLLVDEDSRHKLLQHFVTVLHPYSRLQAFKFAFLQLEQYLPWYRRLLEYTVEDSRDLTKINMKNCIGTVLVINGLRKYYCIFHAYAERMRRLRSVGKGSGSFMGFDDDDSDWEEVSEDGADEKLFHSDLLSGFGIWMEKLMEGTLRRYRVDVWPNMAIM